MRFLGIFLLSLTIASISTSISATTARASAKITLDQTTLDAAITSKIYFYGPAANETVMATILKEINLYWNGGGLLDDVIYNLSPKIRGARYKFTLNVTGNVIPESEVLALRKKASPEVNFIRLEKGGVGDRSYMNGLCSNSGTWFLSDRLGTSTTASHEFGHGLCLQHTDHWRGKGQPPIMTARGTHVDAKYQYDPNATPGGPGGTINPNLRRVIPHDVDTIPLNQLEYTNNVAYLTDGHTHTISSERVY